MFRTVKSAETGVVTLQWDAQDGGLRSLAYLQSAARAKCQPLGWRRYGAEGQARR